jgi:hypothetical protein
MIYIQSDKEKRLPHHFDCACALYGAIENVQDYNLITYEEVDSGKYDSRILNHLFIGSVEFMNKVFSRKNIIDVRLPRNSNRTSYISTLGEVKEKILKGERLFIKPFETKLFTGFVMDGSLYTSISNISDDTKILVYEPFKEDLISEWRLYIHNHNIIDSRNYSGDFKIGPDYKYVNDVIKENIKDFPVAYTIDIGILSNSENVVVEFNDMLAIGNYGIPNYLYLRLLKERYFEIIRNHKI